MELMIQTIRELPSHWILSGVVSFFCTWMALVMTGTAFNAIFHTLFLLLTAWVLTSIKRALVLLSFDRARLWFDYVILAWALRLLTAGIFSSIAGFLYAICTFIFGAVIVKTLVARKMNIWASLKPTKKLTLPSEFYDVMYIWAAFLMIMSLCVVLFKGGVDLLLPLMDILNFLFTAMLLIIFGRCKN